MEGRARKGGKMEWDGEEAWEDGLNRNEGLSEADFARKY